MKIRPCLVHANRQWRVLHSSLTRWKSWRFLLVSRSFTKTRGAPPESGGPPRRTRAACSSSSRLARRVRRSTRRRGRPLSAGRGPTRSANTMSAASSATPSRAASTSAACSALSPGASARWPTSRSASSASCSRSSSSVRSRSTTPSSSPTRPPSCAGSRRSSASSRSSTASTRRSNASTRTPMPAMLSRSSAISRRNSRISVMNSASSRCMGNKVSSSPETRQIEVGTSEEVSRKKHNKIKTSKYTLLMFLPKNLSEQFRRVVNFYFLIVTVISFLIDSPVSPLTSVAPLSFMVMVTLVKQGYEDWLRHKADNKINNQIVEIVHKGVIKEIKNSLISPGTLVRVKRGREVPADLVLICSAEEKGKCYVTTANLDGETNLKTLRVPPPLVGYTADILPQNMRIEVPNPIADLYTFYGRLEIPGFDSLILGTDNLMLRGSKVKNTEWAIGCAVYTGEETKLALNSKYSSNKFSSCELAVNGFLMFFIVLLLLEMFASLAASIVIDRNHPEREVYLGPGIGYPISISEVLQLLFSFLLLYYYIIPMSLYVTIELYKFIGALFIGWDEELRCPETGRAAVANTSDLNEELGQVEILFSDKTGTLTTNMMLFQQCSVNGVVYEERGDKLYDVSCMDQPVDCLQTDLKFFFTILALCHSVQLSNDDMKKLSARLSTTGNTQLINFFKRKKVKSAKENGVNGVNGGANGNGDVTGSVLDEITWNNILSSNGSKMQYQASSPDEKALVEAADRAGVTFLGEEGNNLLLKIGDNTEMYERLQIIEFTSERKRMSVVVRDKDGQIWLFCKGAESAVLPLCAEEAGQAGEVDRHISQFARKGLRTLAVAYRRVPDHEYQQLVQAVSMVDGSAAGLRAATEQYRLLERRLTLAGATGVEDCLQEGVDDTLRALRAAGIRVWLLTGDKVETAINVAQSCALISANERRMSLLGLADSEALGARLDSCERLAKEASLSPLTLILDGCSAATLLDSAAAPRFARLALQCHAVLCCRLSPIQKAKIVKLIKSSPPQPVTAAIGDGANDISMIQEAHVGFGIFGREGYQAARSADFAFTRFYMVKKMLLVMGHWYYQRLATLIHYFFYKNLVLGNVMFAFQLQCLFSTQSVYDSMYLTLYNLVFTSLPCLALAVTDQRWHKDVLMSTPGLYRSLARNRLMSWRRLGAWSGAAAYHSAVLFTFTYLAVSHSVLSPDGNTIDMWSYGAALFHLSVLVITLKLWLQARYHTRLFVASVLFSIGSYVLFNTVYALFYIPIDGDVLGTYGRLLAAPAFWFLNALVVAACLWPDFVLRLIADNWAARHIRKRTPTKNNDTNVFHTRL